MDKKVYQNNFNANFDFSEEEDKFLAYGLFKYGYGSWELIRNEFRNSDRFMFNWIVKTRSIQDIQKRCDYLIAKFKKEVQAIKRMEEEKIRLQKEEEERQRIAKLQKSKGKKQLGQRSNQKGKGELVTVVKGKSSNKALLKRG